MLISIDQLADSKKKPLKFPLLAKSKTTGIVVLFINVNSGIILEKGDTNTYLVGDFSNFVPVDTEDHWEILVKGSTALLTQE